MKIEDAGFLGIFFGCVMKDIFSSPLLSVDFFSCSNLDFSGCSPVRWNVKESSWDMNSTKVCATSKKRLVNNVIIIIHSWRFKKTCSYATHSTRLPRSDYLWLFLRLYMQLHTSSSLCCTITRYCFLLWSRIAQSSHGDPIRILLAAFEGIANCPRSWCTSRCFSLILDSPSPFLLIIW